MTKQKRNSLAWVYLTKMEQELCSWSGLNFLSKELDIPVTDLQRFFYALMGYMLMGYVNGSYSNPTSKQYSIAWKYLVYKKWRDGVRIGQVVYHRVTTESEQLCHNSIEEIMEFNKLLTEAVAKKSFAIPEKSK